MAGLLIAASPVEIEAKAEEAGMAPAAVKAARSLFHSLTSAMELSAIAMQPADGEEWPRHRFYFGLPNVMEPLKTALAGMQDVAEATSMPVTAADERPTLYVSGQEGGYSALLLAGADIGWLKRIAGPLEQAAA